MTAMAMARSLAFAVLAVAMVLVPTRVGAQTPPGQGQMVVVMPFTGEATEGLLRDAETAVRNGLTARGAQVPDRGTIEQAAGVNPPTDPPTVVAFAHNMAATHVVTGVVLPLSGQYTLQLTGYEVATGRPATREGNIGDDNAGAAIAALLDGLFAPGAFNGATVIPQHPTVLPPDPEIARRAEEERQRQEAARQAEAERQRLAAQAAAQQGQAAWETAHPIHSFAAGGPAAVGLSLGLGGLASGARAVPTGVISGTAPAGSSGAFSIRAEGAYALDAVPGLELAAGLMLLTTPTSAVGLGVGAQYTYPARSRGNFHVTGGVLFGLFQGISGSRITSAWIDPYVRAEYQLGPSVAAFAGLGLDVVPGSNGGLTAVEVLLGVRLRFGG